MVGWFLKKRNHFLVKCVDEHIKRIPCYKSISKHIKGTTSILKRALGCKYYTQRNQVLAPGKGPLVSKKLSKENF